MALAVGMAAAARFVFGVARVPSIDAVVTKAAGISTAAGGGRIAVPVAELLMEAAAENLSWLGSFMVAPGGLVRDSWGEGRFATFWS